MTRASLLATIVAASTLAGCYRTYYELTPPTPSVPSQIYDRHFHLSLFNVIETTAPVDLARACNGGPVATIYENTGILAGILNGLFSHPLPLLHLKNVTVLCAYTSAPMGPPGQQ